MQRYRVVSFHQRSRIITTINGTFDGTKIVTDTPILAPPNTRVIVTVLDDANSLPKNLKFDDLLGCAKYSGPPKSMADMEDGIRSGAFEGTGIEVNARPRP